MNNISTIQPLRPIQHDDIMIITWLASNKGALNTLPLLRSYLSKLKRKTGKENDPIHQFNPHDNAEVKILK